MKTHRSTKPGLSHPPDPSHKPPHATTLIPDLAFTIPDLALLVPARSLTVPAPLSVPAQAGVWYWQDDRGDYGYTRNAGDDDRNALNDDDANDRT